MAEEQDNQAMGDPPQGGAELQAQTGGGAGDPPPAAPPPDDGGYTDPDAPIAPIKPGDPPPSDSDSDTETTPDSETTTDDSTPSSAFNTGEGDPPPH